MNLLQRIARPRKGLLFTLLAVVLVTLMFAIAVTYVLIGINSSNQATQAYGILGTADFAGTMQSPIPSLLVTSLQKAQSAYLSANSVGWWPLNGNANDYSRSDDTGTPYNLAYNTVNSVYAASFNAVNSYIDASSGVFNNMTNDLTVSAWVDLSQPTATYGSCIVCQSYPEYITPAGGMQGFYLYLGDGSDIPSWGIYGYGTSNSVHVYAPSQLSYPAWHLVTGTIKGSTAYLYVDGSLVNSGSVPSSRTSNSPLWIGGEKYLSDSWFNGLISDVQIYNYALSASQIASLYAEGPGGIPVAANAVVAFPINSSASNRLSAIVLGPSMPGSSMSDYSGVLRKEALSRNVNVVIANQSVSVFQTSPLWLNATYTALAVVNSTFGTVLYPLSASAALPIPVAYVNITLFNSNTANTPGQFQQMISFNAVPYKAYERSDLGNIRFYQNNDALYSWCESGCSNSSASNSVFWIKVPNGLPAKSNTVITMTFMPKYVTYGPGATGYAGEAPQLSSTYAQYDNGASVFSFAYADFKGTTCPTGFTCSSTIQINSGISIYWNTAGNSVLTSTAYGLNVSQMGDVYGTYAGSCVDIGGNQPCTVGYTSGGGGQMSAWGGVSSSSIEPISSSGTTAQFGSSTSASVATVYSVYYPTAGAVSSYWANYQTATAPSSSYPSSNIKFGIANGGWTTGTGTIGPFYWMRLRAYPPGGAMPAASFGSVVNLV